MNITYMDTETTGLKHGEARVIELSALLPGDDTRSHLFSPGEPIPEIITNITGITDADVAESNEFRAHLADVAEYIQSGDVVCFYNAQFDVGHIDYEFSRFGLSIDWPPVLDPLVWVRHFEKHKKGKKLVQVAERHGVKVGGKAHRAVVDCQLLKGVTESMMRMYPLPESPEEIVEQQTEWAAEQKRDFDAWKRRKGVAR